MRIGYALYSGALMTGNTLAADMLAAASNLQHRRKQRQASYQAWWFAETLEPQQLRSGLLTLPDLTYQDQRPLDVIVLPPIWGNPKKSLRQNKHLLNWLKHHYENQTTIIATSTGVVWLAEAGLLEAKAATTHWYYFEQFRQNYPKVRLNQHANITQAEHIYCAVSLIALSELLLYLIKQWYGPSSAHIIEKHFHHEVETYNQPCFQIGGALQFDESIALAQDCMQRHLAEPLSMQNVAQEAGISLRTLNRKFKDQVGEAPAKYFQKIRLETAKKLLADWSMSIQDVAEQVGYQDSHYFSKLFQKTFHLSPSAYKRIVKAKVYQSEAQHFVEPT
jgi:transcriptional regulator GlxA family with amidase domain